MPENYELIRQCQKKSKKAFDELYRKYSGLVFGICLRYTKNTAEAEDLLHDCFLKIIQNIDAFRFSGSSEGWIRKIALNTSLNSLRDNKNFNISEINDQTDIEGEHEAENILLKIDIEHLLEIINSMPDGYRLVFNLYVVEGYQHKEIAQMLNCSENTSKSQLRKAKLAIIEKLKKLNEIE